MRSRRDRCRRLHRRGGLPRAGRRRRRGRRASTSPRAAAARLIRARAPSRSPATSPTAAGLERRSPARELVVHTAAYVHEWGEMERVRRAQRRRDRRRARRGRVPRASSRFVHLSSVVVYGYEDAGELRTRARRLRSVGIPYIDTKSASDRLARAPRRRSSIRPGDVYGPGSVPWTDAPARARPRGQARRSPAAATAMMLPVYVDDLVEAILLAAARSGRPGEAYAAWDGVDVQLPRLLHPDRRARRRRAAAAAPAAAARARRRGDASAGPRSAAGRRRSPHARRPSSIGAAPSRSSGSARSELGWEPRVGLDEGLRRCAEWARAPGRDR